MIKYVATLWITCGVISAGFDNAYFQRKWPNICDGRRDLGQAIVLNIAFGPVSLVSFPLFGFGEYGWSLSPHANLRCKQNEP